MSEFIQLFFSELSDCRRGVFTNSASRGFLPAKVSSLILGYKKIFKTIGRILGKCLAGNFLSTSFNLQKYIINLIYG